MTQDNRTKLKSMPRSMERYLRPRCERCGDCWLWNCATGGSGVPYMRLKGATISVRRWVFQRMNPGMDITGLMVAPTCLNRPCVSPWCLVAATQSEIQRMQAVDGRFSSLERRATRVAAARRRAETQLTMDKARLARRMQAEEGKGPTEIALALGVSRASVHHALRGDTWRECPLPGSSVFTLAMAA